MADSLRNYEAVLIVAPELSADALQKVQEQFGEAVSRSGGRVLETSALGRKKLSYKIGKLTEGQYLQARIQLPPAAVETVRKAASMVESIHRLLLTLGSTTPAPAFRAEGSSGPDAAAGTP